MESGQIEVVSAGSESKVVTDWDTMVSSTVRSTYIHA